MALFSDKCTALISLETGRHLTGDELLEARRILAAEKGLFSRASSVLASRGWGICGHDVKKKARFCSKCGAPAPKGWIKCPSCGKWVGNEMTHCWNCDHPLHPETRTNLEGGVWNRAEGVFAERFEVGETANMLRQGIQIQEGTAAILLDAGKESRVLGPGRHDPDSTLRAINWFGNPPPRSAVLVDAGEFVIPLRMSEGLATADGMPVSVYAELTLRFVRSRADDFMANVLKDARQLTYAEFAESISGVLTYGVKNLCTTSTVEDLVKDPDRRDQFEAAIRKAASETLKVWGFEIVRVAAADFASAEYEKVEAANREFAAKRREIEFLRKSRELLADDAEKDRTLAARERETAAGVAMDGAKTDHDLAEYMAQLAQEKGIADTERDTELSLLLLARRDEISRQEASYELARRIAARAAEMEAELKDTDHDIALREKLRAYTVEAMLKDELGQEELLKIKARESEIANKVETANIDLEAYRTRTSGTAATDVEADRIRRVGQASAEALAAKNAADLERLRGLREIDRDIDEGKIRAKDAEAARVKGLSIQELVAIADDTEKVKALSEIERIRIQKTMTEEQLLAIAAEKSSAAAEALGTMASANAMTDRERALYEARIQETREDRDKVLAQDRHIIDTFGDVAKKAIDHGEKSTTIGIASGSLSTANAQNGSASANAASHAGGAQPDLAKDPAPPQLPQQSLPR